MTGDSYTASLAIVDERNNHGHAVLWLGEHSALPVLGGLDGRAGWLSSQQGKALLYDACADAFRNAETVLHSFATFTQLASVEGSSLRAPEGEPEDRADSYALACAALVYGRGYAGVEERQFIRVGM